MNTTRFPTKQRLKALIYTTCLLLCACQLQNKPSSTHPAPATLEVLRISEIKQSVYRGNPAQDDETRCKNWKLSEQQAEQFFKFSERYDEPPHSQFYQMSCTISGELIAEGKTWRFEIDGGGTATWQHEGELHHWGCSAPACEPLVILLTDFMRG